MRRFTSWMLCCVVLALAAPFNGSAFPQRAYAQAQTGIIAGKVYRADTGEGIQVSLTLYYRNAANRLQVQAIEASYVSGEYRIDNIPLGREYRLVFRDLTGRYLPHWYKNGGSYDTATPITVSADKATFLEAVPLKRAGQIVTNITSDISLAAPNNLFIEVYDANAVRPQDPSRGFRTINAPGAYTFGGLFTDQYKIHYVLSDNESSTNGFYNLKPTFSEADPISVTAGLTTTVNIDLSNLSTITGIVREEHTQKPIHRLIVVAYSADGEVAANTLSDSSGMYRFRYLMPGTYTILFTGIVDVPDDSCGKGCPDLYLYAEEPYRTPLTVARGQTVGSIDKTLRYRYEVFLPLIRR